MSKPRERNYEPVTVPFAATPAGEPPSIRDVGEPVRLDRPHVDDTRTRSARRTMAHVD